MPLPEEQEEELEALGYIFNEEEFIKHSTDPVSITIKQSVDSLDTGRIVAAAINMDWGQNYPNEPPTISLESIDLSTQQIDDIIASLSSVIESNIGIAMTYTLVDAIKDKLQEIADTKVEVIKSEAVEEIQETDTVKNSRELEKERKMYAKEKEKERMRKRGWDWVDVIHHLRKLPNNQTVPDE